MTTRLITAGVILVAAIVFGFIFWNQFSSNQKDLAGGNTQNVQTTQTSGQHAVIPKHDSVSSVQTELNSVDFSTFDSDSAQLNSQLGK